MTKGGKFLLGTLFIAAAGATVWYFFFKDKGEVIAPSNPAANNGSSANTGIKPPAVGSASGGTEQPDPTAPDAFPLTKGKKGENVKYLQKALNMLGANLVVDGNFGDKTYGAVLMKAGTKYYPVTIYAFNDILKKANTKK